MISAEARYLFGPLIFFIIPCILFTLSEAWRCIKPMSRRIQSSSANRILWRQSLALLQNFSFTIYATDIIISLIAYVFSIFSTNEANWLSRKRKPLLTSGLNSIRLGSIIRRMKPSAKLWIRCCGILVLFSRKIYIYKLYPTKIGRENMLIGKTKKEH